MILTFHFNPETIRDVLGETFKEDDVVLQRIHVMKERETVMDLVMEVNMMVMKDAREILCVAATTVRSLVITITRRMIAVRNQFKFMILYFYVFR